MQPFEQMTTDMIKEVKFTRNGFYVMKLNDQVPQKVMQSMQEFLSKTIKRINPTVTVLLLPYEFGEVESLSEETMKGLGWVRKK